MCRYANIFTSFSNKLWYRVIWFNTVAIACKCYHQKLLIVIMTPPTVRPAMLCCLRAAEVNHLCSRVLLPNRRDFAGRLVYLLVSKHSWSNVSWLSTCKHWQNVAIRQEMAPISLEQVSESLSLSTQLSHEVQVSFVLVHMFICHVYFSEWSCQDGFNARLCLNPGFKLVFMINGRDLQDPNVKQ